MQNEIFVSVLFSECSKPLQYFSSCYEYITLKMFNGICKYTELLIGIFQWTVLSIRI